jgi:hypothetical protein
MGNVSRLRLEQEQQIAVLLCLIVVGEGAFLQLKPILKVACDFILL